MTEYFIVKNWERFQHYKDRNPPWIKLHFEMLSSDDWVMLADASKLLAIVCMMIASRNNGRVPNNPHYFKRVAYLDDIPDFAPLINSGFLKIPLANDSESKQEQADARPETETETEKNKKPNGFLGKPRVSKKAYVFEGKTVRLTQGDYDVWKTTFHAIPDLDAELRAADEFYTKKGITDWFVSVSSWLNGSHQKYLASKKTSPPEHKLARFGVVPSHPGTGG